MPSPVGKAMASSDHAGQPSQGRQVSAASGNGSSRAPEAVARLVVTDWVSSTSIRDAALDTLLDLDGQIILIDTAGEYWVKMVVEQIPPTDGLVELEKDARGRLRPRVDYDEIEVRVPLPAP